MKALRDWMSDNEKLREVFPNQERAIPARVGDQMCDMILAMADVMEAVSILKRDYPSAWELLSNDNCEPEENCCRCMAVDAVGDAVDAANKVIKEVTHGTNT